MGAKSSIERQAELMEEPSDCVMRISWFSYFVCTLCGILSPCLIYLEQTVYNKGTLLPTANFYQIKGWFQFVNACVIMAYSFLFGHLAFMHYNYRRICTCHNIKLFVFSWLLLTPLSATVNLLNESTSHYDKEMEGQRLMHYETRGDKAIESKILGDLYRLTRKAEETVCTKQCTCPGNPHLFKGNDTIKVIVDGESNNEACPTPTSKVCLYFGFSAGEQENYSYQKCVTKFEKDKNNDALMLYKDIGDTWSDELMEMMRNIEEEEDCSGLFRESTIYLFSNVNNGVPKKRCFEEIKKRTDDALGTLYLTAMFPLVIVTIFIFLSTGILLHRIYVKCNCCKNKPEEQE